MSPGAEVGVTIDLGTLYSLVVETRDGVRDLSTKLDNLSDDSRDHETRLRALEKAIWKWAGAAAALGSAGGYFLPMLFGGG